MRRGQSTTHKSYFYCKDIYELLDKFFYDKKKENYVIYEIKLNPES